jgi:hypothetical protein
LAGTDFSSASNKVLKWLKATKSTAKVKAVHVYNVPLIFSLYSKEHLDTKIHSKEKV